MRLLSHGGTRKIDLAIVFSVMMVKEIIILNLPGKVPKNVSAKMEKVLNLESKSWMKNDKFS